MNVRALLTGKRKLLVGGAAALLLFVVLLGAARGLLKSEPTLQEQRLAHLEYMVKLVEVYKKRTERIHNQQRVQKQSRE